ncbi:MAG: hypothetical protein JNK82_39250 [Myxococcaceae bacterium]|nr:hypothetical protein [Myxococcaceae bacterium]
MLRLTVVAAALSFAACQCTTRASEHTYACVGDADCAEGFTCVALVCTLHGGTAGGGEATAGGGAPAGGGTAGGNTTAGGGASAGGGAATAGGGMGTGGGVPPTSLVFTTTPPSPLPAGTCFPAIVEARLGASPQAVTVDSPIGLTAASDAGVGARFYASSNCATSVSAVTLSANQSTAAFWVKPITGGAVTVAADTSFGQATQNLTVLPAVRRGSNCGFQTAMTTDDGGSVPDTFSSCTIAPAQLDTAHTVVFFQATTSGGGVEGFEIRCRMTNTTTIACDRNGGGPSAPIHWQTLELPTGLNVQRGIRTCESPGPIVLTLPTPVVQQNSFVLLSMRGVGDLDDDNLYVASLTSPTRLELAYGLDAGNSSCNFGQLEWQVAELSGLTVSTGYEPDPLPVGEAQYLRMGLSPVGPNTALLTQLRTINLNDAVCRTMVRTSMPSPSSIAASRGAGNDAGCVAGPILQLAWQRLDFGSRGSVQTRTVTMESGDSTQNVTISPVDVTRTLVFASSQAAAGQSSGETNYAGGGHLFGEGAARLELVGPTTVRVQRSRSSNRGVITFYVVEIEP